MKTLELVLKCERNRRLMYHTDSVLDIDREVSSAVLATTPTPAGLMIDERRPGGTSYNPSATHKQTSSASSTAPEHSRVKPTASLAGETSTYETQPMNNPS
jgi:hypothetical protein